MIFGKKLLGMAMKEQWSYILVIFPSPSCNPHTEGRNLYRPFEQGNNLHYVKVSCALPDLESFLGNAAYHEAFNLRDRILFTRFLLSRQREFISCKNAIGGSYQVSIYQPVLEQ